MSAATPRWQGPVPVPHLWLRVTDVDRDQVVEHVKSAFAAGRLDKDELDERLHRAMTARTHADLAPIMTELYGSSPAVPPPARPAPTPGGEERMFGAAAHLLALAGLFVLGPLFLLLTAGRGQPYVREQAVEALNFHLTVLGVTLLLPFTVIGVILLPVIWVLGLVLSVVAGVSALADVPFRYPLTLRLVR